jgi:hypothetical protein
VKHWTHNIDGAPWWMLLLVVLGGVASEAWDVYRSTWPAAPKPRLAIECANACYPGGVSAITAEGCACNTFEGDAVSCAQVCSWGSMAAFGECECGALEEPSTAALDWARFEARRHGRRR